MATSITVRKTPNNVKASKRIETSTNSKQLDTQCRSEAISLKLSHSVSATNSHEPIQPPVLGSLPNGWRWIHLGDVCDFLNFRRIAINELERSNRIANKSKANLFPYYGANGQTGWIDSYIFDEPLILLAEDGGFFGSKDKPIAYSVSGKYWVNNHAHVLKPRSSIDFNYCLHSLRIRPDIGNALSGSTRAKLTQEAASAILIPLPPTLEEQKRIVAILIRDLELLERTQKAVQLQLEAACALPAAYLRTVFDNTQVYQWEKQRLGDICEIQLGKRLSPASKTGFRSRPYLRNANVRWGHIDLGDIAEMDFTEQEEEKFALKVGDLLVCEGGKPGRAAVWNGAIEPCYYQKALHRLRFNNSRVEPLFIMYRLWQGALTGELSSAHSQTTIAHLPARHLAEVIVRLPPIEEQRRIAAELTEKLIEVKRLKTALQLQLANINTLPVALLRRAFYGDI